MLWAEWQFDGNVHWHRSQTISDTFSYLSGSAWLCPRSPPPGKPTVEGAAAAVCLLRWDRNELHPSWMTAGWLWPSSRLPLWVGNPKWADETSQILARLVVQLFSQMSLSCNWIRKDRFQGRLSPCGVKEKPTVCLNLFIQWFGNKFPMRRFPIYLHSSVYVRFSCWLAASFCAHQQCTQLHTFLNVATTSWIPHSEWECHYTLITHRSLLAVRAW